MKFRFLVSLVSIFLVAFSVSAAPKPKMKDVMLAPYVRYQGYMVKKSPSGEGALGVYYSKDLSKADVISGEFNGSSVSGATLCFSHEGPTFKGELTCEIKEDRVVYTLLKGQLSGTYARKTQKVPFTISIDKPTSITRTYNDFCLSSLSFTRTVTMMAREYRSDLKQISNSNKTKLQKVYELVEGIEGCSGVAQTYEQVITLSGLSVVTAKDGYYTCNRFDLPNGAYVIKNAERYELLNSKNYLLWDSKDVVLKKVFSDGLISYDSNEDIAFAATKSYLQNFKELFTDYLTPETIADLNKVKFAPEFKFGTKPVKCLAIEYPDGRKYYGVLKAKEGFRSITDFFTKIKTSSGLPSQESYQDGVLTYPDGRQEIFVKGNTLSQLQEYSQQKEDVLAEKIEQVNLRLILENESCDIRTSLSGNVKSIEMCYDDMCLYLGAKYNNEGRIISTWSSADLSSTEETYHYDGQGRIDYCMSVYQYADAKPEKTQIKYFYDDMGRLIRKESYKKNTLEEKTEYQYNDKNELIDENGNPISMTYTRPSSYSRQYDDRGNIIREVRDDEPIIYTIEYWD